MNQSLNVESQNSLILNHQDDLESITQKLNQRLELHQITAKLAWHNTYLGILLEAASVPDKQQSLQIIEQVISEILSESIKTITVYGRKVGEITPVWYEEIEVAKSPPSDMSAVSLADWLSQGLKTEYSEIIPSQKAKEDDSAKFLHFHVTAEDTALLPLNSIREILNIAPTGVLPVPHMADCIAGVYNYRGEMLWLVDLSLQLGFNPSTESILSFSQLQSHVLSNTNIDTDIPNLTVIVIHQDNQKLGLIVPRVVDIAIHNNTEISSASIELFPSNILDFIAGYLISSNSPVLDVNNLIKDSNLKLYTLT